MILDLSGGLITAGHEHREICDAVETGDKARAGQLMRRHLTHVRGDWADPHKGPGSLRKRESQLDEYRCPRKWSPSLGGTSSPRNTRMMMTSYSPLAREGRSLIATCSGGALSLRAMSPSCRRRFGFTTCATPLPATRLIRASRSTYSVKSSDTATSLSQPKVYVHLYGRQAAEEQFRAAMSQ